MFEPPADSRPRRMTLPDPMSSYRDFGPPAALRPSVSPKSSRQEQAAENKRRESTATTGSGAAQLPVRPADSCRSSVAVQAGWPPSGQQQQARVARSGGRKGSIAQASISSMVRLSHKFSIRRHRAATGALSGHAHTNSNPNSSWSANARRRGSSSAAWRRPRGQSPLLDSAAATMGDSLGAPDPLAVGQQILDAYLLAQRKREAQAAQSPEEPQRSGSQASESLQQAAGEAAAPKARQQAQQQQQQQPPIVRMQSVTRKSFRDFKHISRRLFMRHSSSKTLHSSHSTASSQDVPPNSQAATPLQPATKTQSSGGPSSALTNAAHRRHLLKIKRSETVFETTASSSRARALLLQQQQQQQTQTQQQLVAKQKKMIASSKLAHQFSSSLAK